MRGLTIKLCKYDSPEVQYVADNIRQADALEILASDGCNPKTAINTSILFSTECYAAIDREENPICIFGAANGYPNLQSALIWLLGTEELFKYKRELLVDAKKIILEWLSKYGLLYNFVDVRNEKSIRWLKRLGFNFSLVAGYGKNQEDFYCFWMRKEEW